MAHPLLENAPGKKMLLLGNEAIVRGALEAGIAFVSCYPGTPSSEVPDTFYRISGEGKYYFEYSTNEKVALEVGGGATLGGALTLVTMKHVGVNVAADALMTLAYVGTPGGLVLLSADDPGCHSSQNEQDNRYYARLAGMPVFEPTTAQEAKDMTRDALLLSRELEQPVLLRTTTRVNHLRGTVEFGELPEPLPNVPVEKNPRRFVPIPVVARARRVASLEKMEEFRGKAESTHWNSISGQGKLGVVTTGISRAYVHDAILEQGWQDKVRVLELGMSYPLPEKMLTDFMNSVDKVMVAEELEPIMENEMRALADRLGLGVQVLGKTPTNDAFVQSVAAHLPRDGEYSTINVTQALGAALGEEPKQDGATCEPEGPLPLRPPNLCAGCSHRALYYAVRQVFGDDAMYSSDIGCYTLGILPPLSGADFLLCMGSSVSAGSGMAKASGKTTIGFIGDSTFFHSGITGLINALYNQHDLLLVVLDNRTTAMTGHQPHPGVDTTILGPNESKVDIETIIKGCGVTQFAKVSPYNLKKTMAALEEMKAMKGVRVLLAEEPCVLFARRALKKKPVSQAYVAEQGEEVNRCLETLACPAYYKEGDDVVIDGSQCSGCMVCLQVTKKIKARKRSG